MTYEPMHSAEAQSVRVKEKYLLDLLATIVGTLQEIRINVYFLISESSLYGLSYRSTYSQLNTAGNFHKRFDWNPVH